MSELCYVFFTLLPRGNFEFESPYSGGASDYCPIQTLLTPTDKESIKTRFLKGFDTLEISKLYYQRRQSSALAEFRSGLPSRWDEI